ncbi:MAG: hypothetical protein IPK87_13625 [Planctomycetes bacterium]|nr:hypothetical protein [Planctomycetota bacterium]
MKYDRKPDAYSPKPPAPAPVVEDSHAVQESAARAVQSLLQSRPELGDLELYPSDTFAGMGRRL